MFWIKLFNLVFLLAIIVWFGRKAINAFFKNQREDLESKMKSAAEGLQKIEAEFDEMDTRLKQLDETLGQMRKDSAKDLEKEAAKVKGETEDFVKKLFRDNNFKMEQIVEKTKREFEAELLEASLSGTRDELIGRNAKQDEEWTQATLEKAASPEDGKREYAS